MSKGMSGWEPPDDIKTNNEYWIAYWRERAEHNEECITGLERERDKLRKQLAEAFKCTPEECDVGCQIWDERDELLSRVAELEVENTDLRAPCNALMCIDCYDKDKRIAELEEQIDTQQGLHDLRERLTQAERELAHERLDESNMEIKYEEAQAETRAARDKWKHVRDLVEQWIRANGYVDQDSLYGLRRYLGGRDATGTI